MEHLLSPRDVAVAIGVSESSLKRWADEGLLCVSRTAGGHRRIALDEVLRYIRETGTPIMRPEALGLPVMPAELVSDGGPKDGDAFLVESILQGETALVRAALLYRYLAGESVASLCDGPLREALHKVGEYWHHGADGIYMEHRSIDVCIHAINYLRGFFPRPKPNAMLALGGAPAGDPYLVPSLMAATVLGAEGWREINLGANVPVSALVAAMRKFRPQLVWISFSTTHGVDNAWRDLDEPVALARTMGASFVGGGACVPARGAQPPPPFQALPSMQALAAFANGRAAASAMPTDLATE